MNQKYVVTIDKKAQEVLQAIVAIDTITYYENDTKNAYMAYLTSMGRCYSIFGSRSRQSSLVSIESLKVTVIIEDQNASKLNGKYQWHGQTITPHSITIIKTIGKKKIKNSLMN